jgi:predicted DNA-binding WGR domain protein
VVVRDVAVALRERGHLVDEQVGQSRFRCELAVRDPARPAYALGILVDTDSQYENRNVFERYVSRPRILEGFGWKIVHVLTRDWLHDRDGVLARIERTLRQAGKAPDPDADPDADPEIDLEPDVEPIPPAASFEASPVASSPAIPPARPAVPTDAPADARRFEFIGGDSRKFWHIGRSGTNVVISWGRIGTKGQMQIKQFPDEARADSELGKLVAEKLRKGYVEVS